MMNQIVKRILAGTSAVILSLSAVGPDAFTNVFTNTVSAEGTTLRNGRSTGFDNLEQDTDDDYYNTGYGLHTNKTATALEDGRTFNVNLESWYVGENPVDVATILDASGSMAWTVDTLDPMKVSEQLSEDEIETLKKKYDITVDVNSDGEYSSEEKNQALISIQNGGYLPQDVVDLILDKTKTDNSKLSYADYKYYVYEARPSVSEFVPLGYWDGGDPTGIVEPIAYYPFDGSLKNEITGGEATYIAHPEEGSIYDSGSVAKKEAKVYYTGENGIDISKTAPVGAVKLDLKEVTDASSNKLVITTKIGSNTTDTTSKDKLYDNTVILYITDSENYIKIYRGNKTLKADDSVSNSTSRLRITTNKSGSSYLLNANTVFDGEKTEPNTFTFTFDFSEKTLNVKTTTAVDLDNNKKVDSDEKDYTSAVELSDSFDLTNLQIYVGGATEPINNYSEVFVSNLKAQVGDTEIANYDFTRKSLVNSANEDRKAILVQQAYDNEDKFGEVALESTEAKPEYKDNALDINKTAKNGAIMLDVMPKIAGDTDGFTISMKLKRTNSLDPNGDKRNIFYFGDKDTGTNNYYQFFRSAKDGGFLGLSKGQPEDKKPLDNDNMHYKGGVAGSDEWYTNTLVFEPDGTGKYKVTPYVDGIKVTSDVNTPVLESLLATDLIFLIGALQSNSDGSEHYLDDLYIYDKAFNATQVEKIVLGTTGSDPKFCGQYHATAEVYGEDVEIAQIKDSLYNNPYDTQRRGWYYVNSHSTWEDIEGCLASGKTYIGIYDKGKDDDAENKRTGLFIKDAGKDIATIPSGASPELTKAIEDGNTNTKETSNKDKKFNNAPEYERSIRFYVDSQNHLRCFAWSGSTSKDGDIRTFCSLVYEKQDDQKTKYEELNNALNSFYSGLAKNSDLSNSAIVRFSTNKLMATNSDEHLKSLILKDWTNWSEYYQKMTADGESNPSTDGYLRDLLIPDDGETSTDISKSIAREDLSEYPYVMTGGTYTWTGLKAFYDNMVNPGEATSGTVYNIANDARDKYLIIFTDGRDNTQDREFNSETGFVDEYDENKGYYSETYVTANKPSGSGDDIKYEGQLAEAWANKLKEEGYTIFCVMLAAGSISPTANPDEYDRAKAFVTSLAGGKETTDEEAAEYVSVIGAGASESGESNSLEKAFTDILNKIQQPRDDYVVQDYIDPRFDLVDASGNILELGAGGKITIKEPDGTTETKEVGNIIDNPDSEEVVTLAYNPIESENVNLKPNEDTPGEYIDDENGTGYIYYDNVKDMYYLRWTDQIIPMESEAFNTDDTSDPKYLNVWSATIRLKAKDDFIGGNNILTNGNEAGENLVYSNATIKNMDKSPGLYGLADECTYRQKLEILSGTNRKINAVDMGEVSQAVYGDGIDIPSSGFPRTTANVKLLKLNANNLNDVIYMGELVSPTMMLASLENDYMTDSYYLEYLERYAYRIYGDSAEGMPLIELLNKWLKINVDEVAEKTFTIPYIYLPDPEYKDDKLVKDEYGKVKIQNSTGWDSSKAADNNFADLNLRDITGFITYTWKRDEGSTEEQQKVTIEGLEKYDITKEYVVKDTDQIVYNLQLKFTPLKEEDLTGFVLDTNFIEAEGGEKGDSFFDITGDDDNKEFADATGWTLSNRSEYLQAMVKEQHTYKKYVNYVGDKWQLLEGTSPINNENTYDWSSSYKPVAGSAQIEGGKLNEYTSTPENVEISPNGLSLVANTTYIRDVVNGALALELVVKGQYLEKDNSKITANKEFKLIAKRYYDDPLDPLPYGGKVGADVESLNYYQLTFEVDAGSIPKNPQDDQLYIVWAKLTKVEVGNSKLGGFKSIKEDGYAVEDALPIGTYTITAANNDREDNYLLNEKFKIADNTATGENDLYFQYLKTDSNASSYTYDRFPENVYSVSENAPTDTGDGEYLIRNGSTDNSPKNIAESRRNVSSARQKIIFYFGTFAETESDVDGKKGKTDPENNYTKDRLGIILLSADSNSLAISKTVTYTEEDKYLNRGWEFNITFNVDGDISDNKSAFENKNNGDGFDLTWYKFNEENGKWILDESTSHDKTIRFENSGGRKYTATLKLKHNEKVLISGLQEGTWQVNEKDEREGTEGVDGIFYSAHNNMDDVDEYRFSNVTSEHELNPNSYVDFVNEFPRELPSAGGTGIDIKLYGGIMLVVSAGLYLAIFFNKKRKG